jgi:hypothetical protein
MHGTAMPTYTMSVLKRRLLIILAQGTQLRYLLHICSPSSLLALGINQEMRSLCLISPGSRLRTHFICWRDLSSLILILSHGVFPLNRLCLYYRSTKAVIPVDLYGGMPDMDGIRSVQGGGITLQLLKMLPKH